MPKMIFTQELEGTKRRGRPGKGWREEAERDLQVLGVRRWRELVTGRTKWRDIFRQAKAHNGLQRQWKKKKKEEEYLATIAFWEIVNTKSFPISYSSYCAKIHPPLSSLNDV